MSAMRGFWIEVVGVDRPKLPKQAGPPPRVVKVEPGAQPASAAGATSAVQEGFSPTDLIPDILKEIVKGATSPQKVTGKIANHTDQTLELDESSVKELAHGEFNQFPPDEIKPGSDDGGFVAVSKTKVGATLTGVEGEIRYLLDDKGTVWTLKFNNPHFKSDNDTDGTVISGPGAAQFESVAHAGAGAEGVFTYTLKSKGGAKPQQPQQPQQPAAGVSASCLITVTNNTQAVLTLTHQSNERGDFMTSPATSVPPGGSTNFVFVQTPHDSDPKDQGCKGSLTYQVGNPMAAVWHVEWDNPVGQKNTATATLDPQTAGFASLEQIGQGDENVPVNFTISGGPATPVGAALKSIAVTPANPTIAVGAKQQFTATGTFSDGSTKDLTNAVTWSSSAPGVLAIDGKGLGTAAQVGTAVITATDAATGVSGSTNATVTKGPPGQVVLQSIKVNPANPSIAVGATQQFTATGTFSDGSTQDITGKVTWSSSAADVLAIDGQGLGTAQAEGAAVVTATDAATGLSGSTNATVTGGQNAVLQAIAVTPANPTIAVGATQQFTATGTFSDGSSQDITGQVTWSSSAPDVLAIDASGLGTGQAAGTAVVTATDEATGLSGSTNATVTSDEPEPDFLPPERETEPTLRLGDNTQDGWVEYAQEMLGLPQNGNFDNTMLKAVRAFQQSNGIQVDGVIGFQTWAQLRHTDAKPPSTDGRAPHSFEDAGPKARFIVQEQPAGYEPDIDRFSLAIASVGDQSIEGGAVTLRITRPGKTDTKTVKIGPPNESKPTDEGVTHFAILENFTTTFPSVPAGADISQYFVEAYIEKALGGDFWKGKVGG